MTCLLFDPHLKVRIASASALAIMMDGPSSIFLQVAEYKESTKYGSFMPLSNSLGRILMQLHTGILHLIHSDTHGRLLIQLFKILLLLISSTPYSRMPGELLPKVITSLHARINEGFPFKNDKTGLLHDIGTQELKVFQDNSLRWFRLVHRERPPRAAAS
ncbi:PREDICTED: HEAT repeat-containing protein 6-like [Camelina sativa]|uniref:HEAT repeat-containing protein 6-like n=1 Tax=Camelina sativa TaxID=90675 RepID=A0ABM0Y7A4_CAMSA|nr:PREDICTED: HEAT repeat-containing protein 6-like [Camelina sativa]